MRNLIQSLQIGAQKKHVLKFLLFYIQAKEFIKESMRKIITLITGSREQTNQILSDRSTISNYDCYQSAVNHFKAHCFNWHSPLVSKVLDTT